MGWRLQPWIPSGLSVPTKANSAVSAERKRCATEPMTITLPAHSPTASLATAEPLAATLFQASSNTVITTMQRQVQHRRQVLHHRLHQRLDQRFHRTPLPHPLPNPVGEHASPTLTAFSSNTFTKFARAKDKRGVDLISDARKNRQQTARGEDYTGTHPSAVFMNQHGVQ